MHPVEVVEEVTAAEEVEEKEAITAFLRVRHGKFSPPNIHQLVMMFAIATHVAELAT